MTASHFVLAAAALFFPLGCGGKTVVHDDGEPRDARPGDDTGGAVQASPGACASPTVKTATDGLLHGTVTGWYESDGALSFSGTGVSFAGSRTPLAPGALGAAGWSIATLSDDGTAGSADFSGSYASTEVSSAPSVTHVSQITPGVRLTFGTDGTPPVLVGEFAVFHSLDSGVYMAIRVDSVTGAKPDSPGCNSTGLGTFTFYIQPNGTPDFSDFAGL